MTLPTPDISEIKFQKTKRYRKLRIRNFTQQKYRVLVDVDETNTLVVSVYPVTITPEEEGQL